MDECIKCLFKTKNKKRKNMNNRKNIKVFQIFFFPINKFIIRNPEIGKFKGILQSYYDKL